MKARLCRYDFFFIICMILLVFIMTVNVTKMNQLYSDRSKQVEVNAARNACIIKESLGYSNLPDRTFEEQVEIKRLCKSILGGDALDLIRRVSKLKY